MDPTTQNPPERWEPESEHASDSDASRHSADVELITNPFLVGIFNTFIYSPWKSALVLSIFIGAATWTTGTYYADLKTQNEDLGAFNTRLKKVRHSLEHDFKKHDDKLHDRILIYDEKDQDGSPLTETSRYRVVRDAVESILDKSIRTIPECSTLSYTEPQTSSSASAAAITLTIKAKQGLLQRNDCLFQIRKAIDKLDQKHNGRPSVSMAGIRSVVDSSYDECENQTVDHLMISAPFMAALLLLGVASVPRVMTPFIVLFASLNTERAIVVLIKWYWHDLSLAGPDAQTIFVQLALCMDYALFFWSRFSQERRGAVPGSSINDALFRTVTTSGFVILLSTSVLTIALTGACFYPDLNRLGYLGSALQLMLGAMWVGLYSVTIPVVLAALCPAPFDNHWEINLSKFLGNGGKQNFFRPMGHVVTQRPLVFTIVALVCLAPLAILVTNMNVNFDVTTTDFSKSVREYKAYNKYSDYFEERHTPIPFLLEAPLVTGKDAVSLHQHKYDNFKGAACNIAKLIVRSTSGKKFQIKKNHIQSPWWDQDSGDCSDESPDRSFVHAKHIQHRQGDDKKNATKEVMVLLPRFGRFGNQSQELIKFFWDVVEPHSTSLITNGTHTYKMQAHLYSPLAETMLLQQQYRDAFFVITGITITLICLILGYVFNSYFVGLKMLFTVIFPIIAEYGLTVGIFQYGWLESLGYPNTDGLKWTMPYTSSGFLFALAMDYDLFLFARIYERRQAGYDNTSAVRIAYEETGPMISLAGTLMIIAFGFLSKSTVPVIAQIGALYFFGVAVDVYIVRIWLAPAALCLYEPMNYWPGKVPKAVKSFEDYVADQVPDETTPLKFREPLKIV